MGVTNNNLVNDIDNETVTDWQIYLIYLFQQDYFPKSDMVKHELRVASYEFRVESLKARVEGLKAQVEIQKCDFKSTSYEFETTSYEFKSMNN